MTHNILPVMGNKYLVQFRNQINQQNANSSTVAPPDVLNVNQPHQQQQQQQPQQLSQQHHQQLAQTVQPHSTHHLLFQQQQHQQPQQQQPAQQNDINPNSDLVMTNFNNFNMSNTQQLAGPSGNSSSIGLNSTGNQFNVNGINLELNELKPRTTKMLPKGSTGGNKRIRQIREREQNNLTANNNGGVDLNLASTAIRQDSK